MASNRERSHLDNGRRYDDLTAAEQAAMRALWADRITERLECRNLGAHFEAEVRPYATLGTNGAVVIHNSDALDRRAG